MTDSALTTRLGVSRRVRVLSADDNPLIGSFLREVLHDHFDVIANVENAADVPEYIQQDKPDVIVLDVSFGPTCGIALAAKLRKIGFCGKIVFLTVHQEKDFIAAAFAAGASAYVFKARMHSDLIPAIDAALRGGTFISQN